ncbi:MAG: FG-GAP-like repeat-containing protein [Chloroflexota bacterium]
MIVIVALLLAALPLVTALSPASARKLAGAAMPVGPFVEQSRSTNPLRPPLPAELNRIKTDPFDIYSNSQITFVDIDNDGDQDAFGSGGYEDLLAQGRPLSFYRNVGTAQNPMFEEQTGSDNPFNGTILSGANPVFVDIDGDNDQDLFVAGEQHIPYPGGAIVTGVFFYRNDGSTLVLVEAVPAAAGAVSVAMAKLDGDNLIDMAISKGDPTQDLFFLKNTGTPAAPAFAVQTPSPFAGINGEQAYDLALLDYDADGDADLIAGQTDGLFYYWENTGTPANLQFTARTGAANPFDGLSVKPEVQGEGYNLYKGESTPAFADIDGDGDLDLFSGEFFGIYNYFENVSGVFTQRLGLSNPFGGIDVGYTATDGKEYGWSGPAFVDIDDDGDQDVFISAYNGDPNTGRYAISYFENTGAGFADRSGTTNPFKTIDPVAKSRIAFADFDGDGDYDAVSGGGFSKWPVYYRNTGTVTAPEFEEVTPNPFYGLGPNDAAEVSPTAFDIDGDGDTDVLAGNWDGRVFLYRNTGSTSTPSFEVQITTGSPFDGVDVGDSSAPAAVDMDADGDFDVVIGNKNGYLAYYKNVGATPREPNFELQAGANNPLESAEVWFVSRPAFADLDGNGTPDAFVGQEIGRISYYKNTATWPNVAPAFASTPVENASTHGMYTYIVRAGDLNSDALTITATAKPDWLTLTANRSGKSTLSGMPDAAGEYTVTLEVRDGDGLSATQTFTITVIQGQSHIYLPLVIR